MRQINDITMLERLLDRVRQVPVQLQRYLAAVAIAEERFRLVESRVLQDIDTTYTEHVRSVAHLAMCGCQSACDCRERYTTVVQEAQRERYVRQTQVAAIQQRLAQARSAVALESLQRQCRQNAEQLERGLDRLLRAVQRYQDS